MADNRLKILCCAQDLRGRGAENVLVTFLRYIDKSKFLPKLFVFDNNKSQLQLPEGIELFSANAPGFEPNPFLKKIKINAIRIYRFSKVMKTFEPDIVLCFAGVNEVATIARKLFFRKTVLIISEHSILSRFIRDQYHGFHKTFKIAITKLLYPLANAIVVPAPVAKRDLVNKFSIKPDHICVIGNPLDVEMIEKSRLNKNGNGKSKIIGYVGSLSQEKNVQCLLQAFSLLSKTRDAYELHLIGDGSEREKLVNLAHELNIQNKIFFHGFQRNPIAFIQDFEVIILPSKSEVNPCVIFEAMECGIPVITSNWDGAKDLFRDGIDCVITEINNHEQLKEAVIRILDSEDLRRRLIGNGRQLVRKYYAAKIVKEYEQFIFTIANRNRVNK